MKKSILFNQTVLDQSSDPNRQFFNRLEMQSILISLISGTLFGWMLQTVGKPFLAGFIPVSLILFFVFESLVLTPSRSKGHGKVVVRFLFGILMALLNAFGLELTMFEKTIENSFAETQIVEIVQLDSVFAQKVEPIQKQIEVLELENNTINEQMNEWSTRIFKEVDGQNKRPSGFGDFAQDFSEMKLADSARLVPILHENAAKLSLLEGRLSALDEERVTRQTGLIDPNQRDILERIRALHHILLLPNNEMMVVFFVVVFLLGICLELSTLFVKWANPDAFLSYLKVQERLDAENERLNGLKSQKKIKHEKKELELQWAEEELALQQTYELRAADMKTDHDHTLKDKVADKLKRDDQRKETMTETIQKRFERQAAKSHLFNGSAKQEEKSASEE